MSLRDFYTVTEQKPCRFGVEHDLGSEGGSSVGAGSFGHTSCLDLGLRALFCNLFSEESGSTQRQRGSAMMVS